MSVPELAYFPVFNLPGGGCCAGGLHAAMGRYTRGYRLTELVRFQGAEPPKAEERPKCFFWKTLEDPERCRGHGNQPPQCGTHVLKYNKRNLYPIVDDQESLTKERAISVGIDGAPELYGVNRDGKGYRNRFDAIVEKLIATCDQTCPRAPGVTASS